MPHILFIVPFECSWHGNFASTPAVLCDPLRQLFFCHRSGGDG